MGQKHQTVLPQLKKSAQQSDAFKYAVTGWGNCSYLRLKNNPPSVLFKRIMDCVEKIRECKDTPEHKRDAIAACWDAWIEVTQNNHWMALKAASGVEGANKLDLSMPDDWGNAIGPAVQRNNQYVRPIQALTRGTQNIFYAGIFDESADDESIDCEDLELDDDVATHEDTTLYLEHEYDPDNEEYVDEYGIRCFRIDLNRPCF